jgi:hypothetical protein
VKIGKKLLSQTDHDSAGTNIDDHNP